MYRKKSFYLFFYIAGVVCLIAACSKSAGSAESAPASADAAEAVPGVSYPQAVILQTETALWELGDDGTMNYTRKLLNAGDTVGWKNEQKKALRNTDKAERDFFRVDVDGGDYWVQNYFVAPEAAPGVIVNGETVLYSRADLAAPVTSGTVTIPQYTIVAVHPGMDSGNFTAISAYLEGANNPVVERRYVKKENITTGAGDVQAMKLYQMAMVTKNEVAKKELLKNAQEVGSRFYELIQPALEALDPPGQIETAAVNAWYEVIDGDVNIRDRPVQGGTVVGRLAYGDRVEALEKTVGEETLDGTAAPWYKTAEGWVFGAFLSPLN
jgi:hypothetical protein